MDLSAHFAAIWRNRWAVLIGSVVVAAALYGALSTEPKVYNATAVLSVTAGQAAVGNQPIQDVTPFLATTYAGLAKTRPVIADAATRSGLNIDEGTADGRISVAVSATAGFLNVSATGPSPEAATALARAMGQALPAAVTAQQQASLQALEAPIQSEIAQVQTQLAGLPANSPQRATLETQSQVFTQSLTTEQLQPHNEIVVVSPAQAGTVPIAPKPKTDAVLGLVTALVVLAELAVAYEAVADRFAARTRDEEIRRLTGLSVLAHIPKVGGAELVEGFRTLRTSLLFMDDDQKLRTVAVVSSAPEAGKSFVSINLAIAFADLGLRVVLVDGDMRRPVIDSRLSVERSPGLSDVLYGAKDVSAVLSTHQSPTGQSFAVLSAGAAVADPSGLLSSQLADRVFAGLEGHDIVLVDTPADALFPDASIVASSCDATVVVMDATKTKRRSLQALVERLSQLRAKPLGVVVNRSPVSNKLAGYYSRPEGKKSRAR
jgi:capsular exopolysaccharide synthesis family protein